MILNFYKHVWQLLMILCIHVIYMLKAIDLMRTYNNLYDAIKQSHYNSKSVIEYITQFTVNKI